VIAKRPSTRINERPIDLKLRDLKKLKFYCSAVLFAVAESIVHIYFGSGFAQSSIASKALLEFFALAYVD